MESHNPPPRLVLCFDGTGNRYKGDTSDTNVVKFYQKLDRADEDQYHYYQPGIGTYTTGHASLNLTFWGRVKQRITEIIDEGFGTSFDQHVIAGYQFIMRYYKPGSKIFIFGFSRGAFTARFLARMISFIGLLSQGNEEMVAFAYKTYQNYELGRGHGKTEQDAEDFIGSFKTTFCREGVRVHFLGLWDTVNSVGVFATKKARWLPTVRTTADHVRHAVSIDERRARFKPALFCQDMLAKEEKSIPHDIKEVNFPGNHSDIGGGYLAEGNKNVAESDDPVQLSDLTLRWMIQELEELPAKQDYDRITFNKHKDIFLENFDSKREIACTSTIHNTLKIGGGAGLGYVVFYNILECIPFNRLEYSRGRWFTTWWPNFSHYRSLPNNAVFHPSVRIRIMHRQDYHPWRVMQLLKLSSRGNSN